MIRRLGFFLMTAVFTVVFVHLAPFSASAAEPDVTVLTSLEVTQAVGEVLTRGTSLRVVNVIPEGYPMGGQDAYLKKHRKRFFELASTADAVLTVGAAWSADPLYKWARRGNIRIVNIDAAMPLDKYGAGVALVDIAGKYSPFVWRSPANLTRMASIAADDLCRLSLADTETIKANLKLLQAALFKLRSRYEVAFLDLDSVDLAAFTDGYTYLADEFGLDIHFYELKPESRWTDSDVSRVGAQLNRENVKGVLCAWEPDAKGVKALQEGGAVPVVLDRFQRAENSDPLESLVGWYEGNLSRLVTVLGN